MTKPKRKRNRLSSGAVAIVRAKARPPWRPRSVQNNAMARWIDATPMTAAEVAEKLHVSTGYLYNLRTAVKAPSRQLAVAIEELSEGLVPVNSW